MKELTKAEDQVMNILWRLEKGFVKDIVDEMENPKPAYNTVSTIVRILEKKGFVGYKAFGKTHEYYPLIDKTKYTKFYLNNLMKGYFGGSIHSLVSFFATENKLDINDIDSLVKKLREIKKEKS
ncbi:MAG: BlaI/MecI/CopY family transcriptional regulator [Bacteroidetes bacterium]|nr:BlaI/MecI/CopY family transcriptional regulator [Bacteroidota bacterium]